MIRVRAAAVVAVAALLFAARATAADHVVRVDGSGWPSAVDALPKELAAEDAFWIWSDDCAPQRVTAAQPRRACAATETIALQVASPERRALAKLDVRWGSEEMLRELPDSLLPVAVTGDDGRATVRVPKGAPQFARLAGPALASRWIELTPRTTTLPAVRAASVHLQLRDADGLPARHAILEIRTTDVAPPRELPFRGFGDGTIAVPPLPSGAWVRLLGWSETAAPSIAIASSDHLPPTLDLRKAYALSGKVVDARKSPLPAVRLAAIARAAPDAAIEKRVQSGKQGRFRIEGLDLREVQWFAEKRGFGAISRIARLTGDLDLGAIVLAPARDVRITVRDQRRLPIERALIRTTDGAEATTNAQGIATLKGVPADAFDARVLAFGYLAQDVWIAASAAATPPVVLRDAARVRAHLVRASDGAPAGPGTVAIELDRRKSLADFGDDGEVDVAGLQAGSLSLEIRARGAAPFRLPSRTIAEGEVVDLGVVTLPAGLGITGRVIDAEATAPLAGASIHVLRPSTFGPLLSYARHDWVSAESASDGTFRIDGLAPAVYSLWVEAPGRAPAVQTGIEVGNGDAAIGDLELAAGRTLHVVCEPADRCGTTATVVLRGADWLPIAAPVDRGSATIAPVPAGSVTLRLSDARGILHEREVRISAGEPSTEVRIRLASVRVSGVVMRRGKPVAGGLLLFRPSGAAQRLVQIEHQVSAGSMGSDFLGTVMRASQAEVGDDGRFTLRDATPGEYAVTWSAGAAQSPPVRMSIPETSVDGAVIELRGGTIEGLVLGEDGKPATSVAVTAEAGGAAAQTFAAPDGTFALAGLAPGTAIVRAQTRTLSAEQEVRVDETEVAHVRLTLRPREEHPLTVLVRANGMPLPNAVVFVRENGAMSAATTAGDGTATLRLLRADATIDAAVYSPAAGWAFLPSRGSRDVTTLTLDLPASPATLVITAAAAVALFAPGGFPIDEALPLLGIPSVTAMPLRVPAGRYVATSRGVTKEIAVTGGRNELAFDR